MTSVRDESDRSERMLLEVLVDEGLHAENVGPLVNSEIIEGALLRQSFREVLQLPEAEDAQRLD